MDWMWDEESGKIKEDFQVSGLNNKWTDSNGTEAEKAGAEGRKE